MKKTSRSASGTSFHGSEFKATPAQLRKAFGEPEIDQNDGSDKMNLQWELETKSGKVITIYDWKEFRRIEDEDVISWHIGGQEKEDTEEALQEIKQDIKG